MPTDKKPTRADMMKAERDVGKNIPTAMIGMDDGDVRDVTADEEDSPSSRH